MSESKRDELDRIKAEGCHQYIMTDYCRRLKELRSPVEEIDTAFCAGFDKCREVMQAEIAETKEIMIAGMNKLSDAAAIYKYRCDQLQEDIKPLVAALDAWLTWESGQIYKEGVYVGKKINELIVQGNEALADFQKKWPATQDKELTTPPNDEGKV